MWLGGGLPVAQFVSNGEGSSQSNVFIDAAAFPRRTSTSELCNTCQEGGRGRESEEEREGSLTLGLFAHTDSCRSQL